MISAPSSARARGRLGEGLVVVDQHAEAPHGGVERRERVTGEVGQGLPGGLMDLAVVAEHAVPRDADRRVVATAECLLGVTDADGHRARRGDHRRDLRSVGIQCGRAIMRVGGAQIADVTAEAGVGQDEQLDAVGGRRVDDPDHLADAAVHVAAKVRRDRTDRHQHRVRPVRGR